MSIGEKMKELLEQSAQTSKELASKASAKAQNLGEQGVLILEIKKLKGHIEKLIDSLGNLAYQAFVTDGLESIHAQDPGIKQILDEIGSVQAEIEKKEASLQEKKTEG
jgi:hypothetical protein